MGFDTVLLGGDMSFELMFEIVSDKETTFRAGLHFFLDLQKTWLVINLNLGPSTKVRSILDRHTLLTTFLETKLREKQDFLVVSIRYQG